MSTKDEVRSYQRRMADLANACQQARSRLESVQARREQLVCRQNRLVEQARLEWQGAVRELAQVFGPDTTAVILGLDSGEIARALKATAPGSGGANDK